MIVIYDFLRALYVGLNNYTQKNNLTGGRNYGQVFKVFMVHHSTQMVCWY